MLNANLTENREEDAIKGEFAAGPDLTHPTAPGQAREPNLSCSHCHLRPLSLRLMSFSFSSGRELAIFAGSHNCQVLWVSHHGRRIGCDSGTSTAGGAAP